MSRNMCSKKKVTKYYTNGILIKDLHVFTPIPSHTHMYVCVCVRVCKRLLCHHSIYILLK